jgi:hypothetical protein
MGIEYFSFVNLISKLLYSLTHIKEVIANLCGYYCKFEEADVEGYADLSFQLHNIPYRIRFARRLGPARYTRIENSAGEVVTKYVNQFAGPCRNFYGIPTTPRMLGFESLKIFWRTSTSVIFLENELIILEK